MLWYNKHIYGFEEKKVANYDKPVFTWVFGFRKNDKLENLLDVQPKQMQQSEWQKIF